MQDNIKLLMDDLRGKSLALTKWVEFAKSSQASIIVEKLGGRITSIRSMYGSIDVSKEGSLLALAQLQAREDEVASFLNFIKNAENEKKTLDLKIRECESRIKEMRSDSRSGEPTIEPSER